MPLTPSRTAAVFTTLALLAGTLTAAVPAGAATSTIGAAGAGDPYFPRQGNGGYDVSHYRLALDYTPRTRHLAGVARVEATALQKLTRFNLDLRPDMKASKVVVDGRLARFSQPKALKQELIISPARALAKGHRFVVVVTYAGTAAPVHDADGALDGWVPTRDGAVVVSEPQGSPTWFPVNDTPRDKATYTVSITTPRGLVSVSNGRLLAHTSTATKTTWSWRIDQKISSYLVTATLGKFRITTGRTPKGVPYFTAVDPTQAASSAKVMAKLPAIVDYFSGKYGAYPFGQTGGIVDDAAFLGFALETATRPVFDGTPSESTLAHELAHQWYGDTVTLKRWKDIWINEGFAQFSQWLWIEHTGGTTAHQRLKQLLARPASDPVWNPPPANPGSAKNVFADSVYVRGAGALQALREKVGDRTFFAIMKGWVAAHRYGNATALDFTLYAGKVAHRDLKAFFDNWIYERGKP